MKNFNTIYDLQNTSMFNGFNLIFLGPLLMGCAIFFFYKYNLGKSLIGRPVGDDKRKNGIYWGLGIAIFGLLLFSAVLLKRIINRIEVKNFASTGYEHIAEGYVQDYHPMPTGGHGNENFMVDSVYFEYSPYDESDYGYNIPSSHGGAIKKDLYVKINYVILDGRAEILKLQIAK